MKLLLNILLLMIMMPAANAVVTVGDVSDADCDYSDLQLAFDSGDSDIRISAQTTYSGNFIVSDRNAMISGGFSNCNQASQNIGTPGLVSQLISSSVGAVFTVDGGGIATEVILSDLEISGATDGSGLLISAVDGFVRISNSRIINNTSDLGAGIYLSSTGTELRILNSEISNNIAMSKGGGIYCKNADVIIDSKSLLSSNVVLGTVANGGGLGGAIYSDSCNLQIYAGHSDGVSAGIISNQSTEDGAGIYAQSSSLIINGQQESPVSPVYGDNTQPVLFKDNLSDSDNSGNGYGAALFLRSSTAQIQAAWFDENKGSVDGTGSYNRGSVFYAKWNSVVTMGRDISQPCWRAGLCNLVTNNNHVLMHISRAPTSVTVTDTEFRDNTSDWTGMIHVLNSASSNIGDGPYFTFENNLVHNNSSERVGFLKAEGNIPDNCCITEVNLFNNTFANNQFGGEVFTIRDNITLNMHANIVHEPDSVHPTFEITNSAFTTPNISCLMASEIASVPDITPDITSQDPAFVDSNNADYHLLGSSPAIDFCGTDLYMPATLDMDQQLRGRDEPAIQDLYGLIDLGVDEYYPPDEIFSNDFETTGE